MSPAANVTQAVGGVTIQSLHAAVKYCTTAASALLIWHHLLTLDREVAFFWKRKPSGASGLFFANRYLILIYSIYNLLWEPVKASKVGCTADTATQFGVYTLQYLIWTAFSCLRVYALRRQWAWAVLVLLLSLVPAVMYTAQFRSGDSTLVPFGSCTTESAAPVPLHLSLSIVARVSVIVADMIVMALTWSTTHGQHRVHVLGVAKTLSSVLYRNGAMYFMVLTIINVLYLVSYSLALTAGAMATGVRASFFYGVINDTYTRLTAILMTHFLLDLQEAANASTHPSGDSQQGSTSILQFARADVDHWIRELRPLPPIDFTDDIAERCYQENQWACETPQPRDVEFPARHWQRGEEA